jgi:tetratricopeptide (TPR) repeat protein
MIRHGLLTLLSGLTVVLGACTSDLSPVQPVLEPVIIRIADSKPQELRLEAATEVPVLITLAARDVDIRAAVVSTNHAVLVYADAPNRRMGIETLLVEPPHDQVMTLRIERNDHQEARGSVRVTAVGLPTVTKDDRKRIEAARLEATACLAFPDPKRAQESSDAFVAAAESYGRIGDRLRSGTALLHAAGVRYSRDADWEQAAALASDALSRLDGADAPVLTPFAMRLLGAALAQHANTLGPDTYSGRRTVERARKQLTEAATRLRSLGLNYEAGYALNYRGVSYLDAGEREQARADFTQALDLFRSVPDPPAQALSLQSLALLSYEDGRLGDAMREFDQALALIPRDLEPGNYAHTLHNSALPLRVLGRFDEAMERYLEAGSMLRSLGDRDGEARALHGLGTTLKYLGEPGRARDFLRAAAQIRNESGASRERAITLIVLGQIEREAGNPAAALALHREASGLVDAPRDRARVHLAIAQDFIATEELSKARGELETILRLELPETHRHLGMALTELGAIDAHDGDMAAADNSFAKAIAVHTANGSEFELARALFRRAEAHLRIGDTQSVLSDTTAALSLFDGIGLHGTQAEGRASFRATYRDVTELQISALVTEAANAKTLGDHARAQRYTRAALIASDRAKVRMLIDAYSLVHAPDAIDHQEIARRREIFETIVGKRRRLEELLETGLPHAQELAILRRDISMLRAEASLIDGRLAGTAKTADHALEAVADKPLLSIGDDVLVIEYFLGKSNGWMFSIRNGQAAVQELRGAIEIESMAREVLDTWRSPGVARGDTYALSRRIARMLLSAVPDPAPTSTLWVVPDGALHLVPLAVLMHEYWPAAQPGSILVVPSLTAIASAQRRRSESPPRTLAVIADPVYALSDPRLSDGAGNATQMILAQSTRSTKVANGLQRIPSTGLEARTIIAIVGRSEDTLALTGLDANRPRVTSAPLDQFRIVHFATHAVADDLDAALSSLALSRWNSQSQAIDGELRYYDITQMRLNADLVVLSGCETAVGKEIAGEGPIGLSQAFLRAGAHSVLASLWRVPDSSTAFLMKEFYQQLLTEGESPAAALLIAQQAVRHKKRWSDPYYWAGFQLVSVTPTGQSNNNVVRRRESKWTQIDLSPAGS